jgi:subtilisin family serine protease
MRSSVSTSSLPTSSLPTGAIKAARIFLCLALLPGLAACGKFSQDVKIDPINVGGNSQSSEDSTSEYGSTYEMGAPSTRAATTSALFLGASLREHPYDAPSGGSFGSLFSAHTALNTGDLPIASTDTGATTQWDAGWTGKGVKVAVLDEFTGNDRIDSHGELVSVVVNSVAPEATLEMRHFDLIMSSAFTAWADFDANDFHIVNNSLGLARFNHVTQAEYTGFDADVAASVASNYRTTGPATYSGRMLFVFSAGNSGELCPDRRIQECSFDAAVVYQQRANGLADKDAMIWVGSLNDAGTDIAPYSHTAGDMKNDFIVAHDDVLAPGDGAGTSFAAPRVTGAAALVRHKFPFLNGTQLKDLLLGTATDIGAAGIDEVYGHGKLDLANALSPQGALEEE